MNVDFVELMTLWCKAHPDFYNYPFFEIVERYDRKEKKSYKCLTTFVNTGRVCYRGKETRIFHDLNMTDSDCCRSYLISIMENKSFQDHFKTMHFDSVEELALKLAVRGKENYECNFEEDV